MNAIKLLKQHKRSAEVINIWFTNQMLKSIKTDKVPEEFKEYVLQKGIELDKIAVFIDVNPRCLFDMLDEHEIIIQILHSEEDGFSYRIGEHIDSGWKTRKDAESNALEMAIKQLESKLK